MEYNVVHRELVGAPDKSAFIVTMTRLHAALFGLSPDQARASAEERVLASTLVDRITSGESTDKDRDWAQIRAALERCYRSIQAQLPPAPGEQAVAQNGSAYAFTSHWDVEAPIDAVWDAIYDSNRWPDWWPFVASVQELAPGDPSGVGAVRRYTWRTRLPYAFTFGSRVTKVERPRILEAAVTGDLNGVGCWTLTPNASGTHVQYDWNVRTRAAWMNMLAPVARPLFKWNHDAVMRSGAEGLGALLGAPVHIRAEAQG